MSKTMDQIVSHAKHRGFVFQGSEIYGGLANTWDYGPLGVELKTILKSMVEKIHSRISIQRWFRRCDFNESKNMGSFWSLRKL